MIILSQEEDFTIFDENLRIVKLLKALFCHDNKANTVFEKCL